jgi:hypothetical protein
VNYDAQMAAKATTIAKNVMDYAVGLSSTADTRWDITRDGKVNIGDAVLWARVGSGDLLWSSLGLPAFGTGSDGLPSDGPIYAHQYEKIIDPVSSQILSRYGIKVQADGGNSKEVVDEIKALKKEISDLQTVLIKITQGGFTALVEETRKGNKDLKTAANSSILDQRRAA